MFAYKILILDIILIRLKRIMKILTGDQIRAVDQYTILNEPIKSIDLMERTAHTFTQALIKQFSSATPVKIFAGPGNNGGDALAIARILADREYDVDVYLFNPQDKLSENCIINKDRLIKKSFVQFHEIKDQFTPPILKKEDLIIDGLFGTGLNRPLSGGFASVIQYINSSKSTVISIDIPSGLMCEDNTANISDYIIRADITFTLQMPKLSFLFADNDPFLGRLEVLDIHLSQEGIMKQDTPYSIIEAEDVHSYIKPRKKYSHKGTFGHALLIAGKYCMAGASVLAAKACLRSGVGLVTVNGPSCNRTILQESVPEAIYYSDPDERCFTTPIIDIDRYTALAIGPGIGTEKITAQAMIKQIQRCERLSMVIDADAINLLSEHKDWISHLPKYAVLTPHPKELERMVGKCRNGFERLSKAKELAIRQQIYIILKGAYTTIIDTNGQCRFNPTGNPGMATGGSGDVLTGILLALLAQKYEVDNACVLAVYIHGLAGDLAAQEKGEISLVASDIIEYLPKAWKKIQQQAL